VANGPDKTVSRVDIADGAVTKINLTGEPQAVAFDDGTLWAASSLTGAVSAIDIERSQVQSTIEIGSDSRGLAVEGDRVWVATLGAANAHRGGTLRVVLEGGEADTFDSIDPGVTYRSQAWQLLSLVHDGLVAFRRDGGPVGATLVPDLAASIPAPQDGGKTYTFRLRDGITYSTGDRVQAQDFRRAIEREFQFGTGFAAVGLDLLGAGECGRRDCDLSRAIETDDAAGTVTFHLATPDPEFLYKLALPWGAPVPSDAPRPSYPGKPVPGTGAYMIRSYEPDRRLVLTRNPRFEEWSEEAQPSGYVDTMVWSFGLTPSQQVSAVQRDRADVMLDDPPPARIQEIVTLLPTQAHSYVRAAVRYMFLNTRIPPFDDLRARRAINFALDRAAVVKAWGGSELAQPTCQVLPPGLPGWSSYCPYTKHATPTGTWSAPDLKRARQLVHASHTGGQELVVYVLNAPQEKAGARRVAADLERIGYEARLEVVDGFNRYYSLIGKGSTDAQIAIEGWFADYPTASNFFPILLTCDAYTPNAGFNYNPAGFCDRRVDALIRQATEAQADNETSTAAGLWSRVDRAVVDAAPWLPLLDERGIDLVSERVGNYERNPQLGVLFSKLWVK
jgi:peptide/nickel transport system substrate-binding protein